MHSAKVFIWLHEILMTPECCWHWGVNVWLNPAGTDGVLVFVLYSLWNGQQCPEQRSPVEPDWAPALQGPLPWSCSRSEPGISSGALNFPDNTNLQLLNSSHRQQQQLVSQVISTKNGKQERSWKVSPAPPCTWKQALIKTNYSLKSWKEGERGNLTDLCLGKKLKWRQSKGKRLFLIQRTISKHFPGCICNF